MIILYGNGYSGQDLVGRQVKLHSGETAKIVAVNHYGFILDREPVEMLYWYDEEKTWSWVDTPKGHR